MHNLQLVIFSLLFNDVSELRVGHDLLFGKLAEELALFLVDLILAELVSW